MRAKLRHRPGPVIVRRKPEVSWHYCDRIEPGEYPARSRSANIYLDGYFHRWVCAVQFDILSDSLFDVIARLTWYLNLDSRDRPHAGRRGRYWQAWTEANGGPRNAETGYRPRHSSDDTPASLWNTRNAISSSVRNPKMRTA